jgi:hypothetical protein
MPDLDLRMTDKRAWYYFEINKWQDYLKPSVIFLAFAFYRNVMSV